MESNWIDHNQMIIYMFVSNAPNSTLLRRYWPILSSNLVWSSHQPIFILKMFQNWIWMKSNWKINQWLVASKHSYIWNSKNNSSLGSGIWVVEWKMELFYCG